MRLRTGAAVGRAGGARRYGQPGGVLPVRPRPRPIRAEHRHDDGASERPRGQDPQDVRSDARPRSRPRPGAPGPRRLERRHRQSRPAHDGPGHVRGHQARKQSPTSSAPWSWPRSGRSCCWTTRSGCRSSTCKEGREAGEGTAEEGGRIAGGGCLRRVRPSTGGGGVEGAGGGIALCHLTWECRARGLGPTVGTTSPWLDSWPMRQRACSPTVAAVPTPKTASASPG